MSATKFFVYPFGVSGLLTAVPDPTQVSGVVSYQQGFGTNYTLVYGVDPGALPVPEGSFNQLFYDVTLALQQYQTIGTPNFITSAQNLGTPYPYLVNAYALWTDGNVYQAIANNSTTPIDTTSWRLDDNNSAKLIKPNVPFEGTVVSGNAVYWNSGTSQFTKAIANGAAAQQVVGFADLTYNRIYMAGDIAILSGLTPGSQYFLSTVTAGAITTVQPTFYAISMGIALSATELLINIAPYLVSSSVSAKVYFAPSGSGQILFAVSTTQLLFDALSPLGFDPFSMWDAANHRFIIPQTGKYRINGNVITTFSTSTGSGYWLVPYLNGTTPLEILAYNNFSGGTSSDSVGGSDILSLAGGNTLDLRFASASATNTNVDVTNPPANAIPGSYFAIEYLGN